MHFNDPAAHHAFDHPDPHAYELEQHDEHVAGPHFREDFDELYGVGGLYDRYYRTPADEIEEPDVEEPEQEVSTETYQSDREVA